MRHKEGLDITLNRNGEQYDEHDVARDPSKWSRGPPENCKVGGNFASLVSQVAIRRKKPNNETESATMIFRVRPAFEWHGSTALKVRVRASRGTDRWASNDEHEFVRKSNQQEMIRRVMVPGNLPLARLPSTVSSKSWKARHRADQGSVTIFVARGNMKQTADSEDRQFERLNGSDGDYFCFEFQVNPKGRHSLSPASNNANGTIGYVYPVLQPLALPLPLPPPPPPSLDKFQRRLEDLTKAGFDYHAGLKTSTTAPHTLASSTVQHVVESVPAQHPASVATSSEVPRAVASVTLKSTAAGMAWSDLKARRTPLKPGSRCAQPSTTENTTSTLVSPVQPYQQSHAPDEKPGTTAVRGRLSIGDAAADLGMRLPPWHTVLNPSTDQSALLRKRAASTAGLSSAAQRLRPEKPFRPSDWAGIFPETVNAMLRKSPGSDIGASSTTQQLRPQQPPQLLEKDSPPTEMVSAMSHALKIDLCSIAPQLRNAEPMHSVDLAASFSEIASERSKAIAGTPIKREHSLCSGPLEVREPVANTSVVPAQSLKKVAEPAVVDLTDDDDDLVEVKKESLHKSRLAAPQVPRYEDDDQDEEDLELELREIRAERKLRALRKAKQVRVQAGGQ